MVLKLSVNLCRSGKGGLSIVLEAKKCFESVVSCTIFLTNVSSSQEFAICLQALAIIQAIVVLKTRMIVLYLARFPIILSAAVITITTESRR